MVGGNGLMQNDSDPPTMDTVILVIFAMWWLWVVGWDVWLFDRQGADESGIKNTRGGQDCLVTNGCVGCN